MTALHIGSHGYNMPWFAYVTPLACFIAVINDTRCIIRKRQTARFPFRVVDILTENQCLVSHEHLISWTLVHCWNTGRTTLSAESIRCKCTNDTIRADKVSERWGVNTEVTFISNTFHTYKISAFNSFFLRVCLCCHTFTAINSISDVVVQISVLQYVSYLSTMIIWYPKVSGNTHPLYTLCIWHWCLKGVG